MNKRPQRPKRMTPRTFVKEWREYREMTQEVLAEKAGMSVSNISQLEQRRQGYSTKGLEALAKALRCTTGQLLTENPAESDDTTDAWKQIWDDAKPEQRRIMMEVAKTIKSLGEE